MRTKLLALTYSAWSEAQISQILYTPDAFTSSEISNILKIKKSSGITAGWNKLLAISLDKVITTKEERNKKKKELRKYIDTYIRKQSQIRNNIAHGQWINTIEKNPQKVTESNNRLNNLNVVDIMIEYKIHTILGKIIRDLVQSPNNGFKGNYINHINNLKSYLNKTKNWTISNKFTRITPKFNY